MHQFAPSPPVIGGQLFCRGSGVGKDQRRVYTCPQCGGARVVTKWKQAGLDDAPEVQEIQTTEDCPTCDGAGQILGPST